MPLAVASATAAGSAVVHFAVAPEHFNEWWGFGLFFVFTLYAYWWVSKQSKI